MTDMVFEPVAEVNVIASPEPVEVEPVSVIEQIEEAVIEEVEQVEEEVVENKYPFKAPRGVDVKMKPKDYDNLNGKHFKTKLYEHMRRRTLWGTAIFAFVMFLYVLNFRVFMCMLMHLTKLKAI